MANKYYELVPAVLNLQREGRLAEAEKLLLQIINTTELEVKLGSSGVAPWYYERLAIIYAKQKQYHKEVAILERFAAQKHAPGVSPPKLLERLKKAKDRLNRQVK